MEEAVLVPDTLRVGMFSGFPMLCPAMTAKATVDTKIKKEEETRHDLDGVARSLRKENINRK